MSMNLISSPYPVAVGGGGVPSTLADMWMWGEPRRETGLSNNDPMPQLTDQHGNNRHWTQATTANKPLYETGILNGHACARGEGWHAPTIGPHFWTGPDLSVLTAAHVFILVKFDLNGLSDTIDNGLWKLGTNGNTDHFPWIDDVIYDGCMSNVRKTVGSPGAQSITSWRLVEVISTSSEWTMLMDGTQKFTTGTNTVSGNVAPLLMRNGGGDALKGYFAGLYICSAKLTTDRATLITYINSEFAQSFS